MNTSVYSCQSKIHYVLYYDSNSRPKQKSFLDTVSIEAKFTIYKPVLCYGHNFHLIKIKFI